MQLKVLERKPNELTIEVQGEGHTFCNLLESVLLEDKKVEFAGYDISHPLVSNPVITIRMKGKGKPEEAMKRAIKKILQQGKKFSQEFANSLKKSDKRTKKA